MTHCDFIKTMNALKSRVDLRLDQAGRSPLLMSWERALPPPYSIRATEQKCSHTPGPLMFGLE